MDRKAKPEETKRGTLLKRTPTAEEIEQLREALGLCPRRRVDGKSCLLSAGHEGGHDAGDDKAERMRESTPEKS